VIRRVRAGLWVLGAPARWLLIALIRVYRATLSGWLGGQCKFYPSCSRYAEDAIRIHGAGNGSLMAVWRIARCGPFTDGGVDHVPARRGDAAHAYDAAIHGKAPT